MLIPVYKKSFEKDVKRAKKRQKDMSKLKRIIKLLLNKQALPLRYRDHNLSGKYSGHRECHLEPDWLLIYKLSEEFVILERTGSHSDLFK